MQRLQQEAVRRVREMQSRAQIAAQPQAQRTDGHNGGQNAGSADRQGNGGPQNGGGHDRQNGQELRPSPGPQHPAQQEGHSPELLRLLFQQEDRTLILLLLLLLVEENQDPSLLLALLYLAMSPE